MPTTHPNGAAAHSWFYVGGEYVTGSAGTFKVGQMYVEHYQPKVRLHETPVVMIHGGVQSGSNFIATADRRRGWLGDFLAQGYCVYIVDQPERGRSGHRLTANKAQAYMRYSAETIENRFTAPANAALWPQAHHHTQWPGNGQRGDLCFDQFFASQVEQLSDLDEIERLNKAAGCALIDTIGDAILLTHSQSGPFGWLIADARPTQIKAILSIEPNGPPFKDIQFLPAPDWLRYQESLARPFGITRQPLQFDPPVNVPEDLQPRLVENSPDPELMTGYLPGGEPRTLPNLSGIPILLVTAQASYHACYDHCTSNFLRWAGVEHDFVRLESRGITGNGHMVMLEKNSHQIADLLLNWLGEKKL